MIKKDTEFEQPHGENCHFLFKLTKKLGWHIMGKESYSRIEMFILFVLYHVCKG